MAANGNLRVRYRKLSELEPYPNNARTHSDEQIAQIMGSMQEFGFTNPILIDEKGGIIAGHGRLTAAQRLEMDKVPTITLKGLSEAQKRAYVIADNKLALNAGWNEELLGLELKDLLDMDFDIGLIGFSDTEINLLLPSGQGLTDPDAIPENVEQLTNYGDLWILGNHRLLCGDATNETDVKRLCGSVLPHLMVTDPPYGVEYDPKWRLDSGVNKPWQKRAEGVVTNDDQADWLEAWILFPGDVVYVWCAPGPLNADVLRSLQASGFEGRMQIVWAKSSLVIGRGHYHCQHENCWYAVRKGQNGHWVGGRKQSTIWNIDNMHRTQGNVDDGKTNHSTQKPVECMRRPIVNNSSQGQAVYDPFLGSGTTIIAAETEGRHCYGLEIDPGYCDIIVKRWEDFTGQKAVKDEAKAA